MKHYYRIRFAAIASSQTIVDERNVEKEVYASTAHCASYFSSRSSSKESKSREEASNKYAFLEEFFANFVLALGTGSTLIALWVYSGNALSSYFYLSLVGVVLFTLLLPSVLAKLNIFPYLSSLSVMCVLVALGSFGSGMMLMRNNPQNELNVTAEKTETTVHIIEFGVVKAKETKESKEVAMKSMNITTN